MMVMMMMMTMMTMMMTMMTTMVKKMVMMLTMVDDEKSDGDDEYHEDALFLSAVGRQTV